MLRPDSLCAHSNPCGPVTAVSAVVVSADMTTTAPGWRTAWESAITHCSWPTWRCSWWCFCGACTWHGGFPQRPGWWGGQAAGTHQVWREPGSLFRGLGPSPKWPAHLGSLGQSCHPHTCQLWVPLPLLPCRSGLRFFRPWGLWLRSSGLLFATFLLLSLFSLVASLLLASHLYLVASNTTTWEFISSHRIAYLRQRSGNPFDRGLTRNLAHFFCGWPSGSWETLWAEDEEGSSQDV